LTEVRVFSRNAEHRTACAEKLGRELQIAVLPASSADEALATADVVITATNSTTPVFDGRLLREGTHVTSIANGDKTRIRQEIDELTLRRAAPVFITSKTTVCANESDIFRAVRDGVISWQQVHEISDLLLGKVSGRTDERQITLFKLQGTGIMDVAIGRCAYEKIKNGDLAQRL
jgi:ornithine cyclodeaminase/alanine dehydrogenase-like protein (mu-crystallin family)